MSLLLPPLKVIYFNKERFLYQQIAAHDLLQRANEPLKSGINLMTANYKCVLNVLLFASSNKFSQIDNQI